MKCPKCGAEVKEGLAACSVCFAPLTGEEAERVAKLAKEAPQITPRTQRKAESVPGSSGGKGGKAVAVILLIILLAAAGAGGWYYFIYMRSPQYAARQFLDALKAKDYEKIYQSCVWTGFLGFVKSGQDVQQIFNIAKQIGLDVTIESYSIKEVTTQENRATVKTSVTRGGKNDDWNVIVVKGEDGKWKCDLLSSIMSAAGGSLKLPSVPGLRLGR